MPKSFVKFIYQLSSVVIKSFIKACSLVWLEVLAIQYRFNWIDAATQHQAKIHFIIQTVTDMKHNPVK